MNHKSARAPRTGTESSPAIESDPENEGVSEGVDETVSEGVDESDAETARESEDERLSV